MHPVLHAFLSQTGDAAPSGAGGPLNGIVLFAGMIAIFYFVLWRPQAKERKKTQQFIAELKKGDEVITQGGIVGTVMLVEDRTVTVDVGSGTKMRVLKSYVAGPWKQVEPQQPVKAEAKK
jgi:preprotein translocase subunit YajC